MSSIYSRYANVNNSNYTTISVNSSTSIPISAINYSTYVYAPYTPLMTTDSLNDLLFRTHKVKYKIENAYIVTSVSEIQTAKVYDTNEPNYTIYKKINKLTDNELILVKTVYNKKKKVTKESISYFPDNNYGIRNLKIELYKFLGYF